MYILSPDEWPCSDQHGTCPESDRRIPILDELQARVDREAALEIAARPDPGSSSTKSRRGGRRLGGACPERAAGALEGAPPPAPPAKPSRGGKRPGAGAPKGNMNALKHGLRSKQFAAVGRFLAQDPNTRDALLKIAGRADLKRFRANEMAALLLTMLFERAQSLSHGRLNEPAPTDDWRSIKAAARFLSGGKHGADQKVTQTPPHNQSPDRAANSQSDGTTQGDGFSGASA